MSIRNLNQALKPLQARMCSRSFNQARAFTPRAAMPKYAYNAKRMITERSFAEERLKEMGETLDPNPDEGPIEVDFANIDTPNARVAKIVDEVLDLNIIEVNMFFKAIQVIRNDWHICCLNHPAYTCLFW